VAVTRETLRLTSQLRVVVGTEADIAIRTTTRSWMKAWSELARQWHLAASDVVALQAKLGRWPFAWELSRLDRLQVALNTAERQLTILGAQTGVTVTDATGNAIRATVEAEPRIVASQLPATQQVTAVTTFNARILPAQVEAIVARTAQQVTASTRPLPRAAYDAMQRELIRGVAVGASPRETGRRMVARVEGAFSGGIHRATTIAATETLDAYRAASKMTHAANQDVVRGWTWHSVCDRRSCPACFVMHGSEHPVSEPGPAGHQRCRCARLPLLRSWKDIGFSTPEPASKMTSGRDRFDTLPEATQRAILGDARFDLLRSGRIGWDDLATQRSTVGWRDSVVPTPVRDLQRLASLTQ
jgi:SPP1 gp7 family putative phage head morphogenesis protein